MLVMMEYEAVFSAGSAYPLEPRRNQHSRRHPQLQGVLNATLLRWARNLCVAGVGTETTEMVLMTVDGAEDGQSRDFRG